MAPSRILAGTSVVFATMHSPRPPSGGQAKAALELAAKAAAQANPIKSHLRSRLCPPGMPCMSYSWLFDFLPAARMRQSKKATKKEKLDRFLKIWTKSPEVSRKRGTGRQRM